MIGTLACGPPFINSVYFLFTGRFIVGFAVGMESSIVRTLLYFSKLMSRSQTHTHTTTGTHVSSRDFTCGDQRFSGNITSIRCHNRYHVLLLDWCCFVSCDHGWQVVLGLTALPAIAQILCAPIIAESPRWLMLRGRKGDSIAALSYASSGLDLG